MSDVDTTETITHLSLCSGYDGIGLGLRRVWPSVREIAHVEIEAFAAANLVAKMEAGELDAAPVWTDLKTFPAWRFRGCVDILSAGFPCQPFSCAGARAADDDPRHLWPHVRQSIGLIRPRMVILENVQGIISTKLKGTGWNDPEGTPVLLHVLRELERTGYRVEAGVFSASEVGAPHQRKRVFIVGVDDTECIQGRLHAEGWCIDPKAGPAGEELANTSEPGSQRNISDTTEEGWQDAGRPVAGCCEYQWPARPGEEQYEWEEPRTIEPGLGGTVDGFASRVDRLRLLGNGVVPQTAERAVRVLVEKLLNDEHKE